MFCFFAWHEGRGRYHAASGAVSRSIGYLKKRGLLKIRGAGAYDLTDLGEEIAKKLWAEYRAP